MGMNGVAISKEGVHVYRHHEHQFDKGTKLENDILAQKAIIAQDPNICPEDRKELMAQLDHALEAALRAKELSSTTKLAGKADESHDRDDSMINKNLSAASERLFAALGEYTDAQQASAVPPPPKPLGAAPSDINMPELKTAEAKIAEALKNPAIQDAAERIKNAGANAAEEKPKSPLMSMSPQELVALQKSDPAKFFDMMSDLSEQDANTMNQTIQNHLQTMNRVFSLISNITQALHQTQKALIGNIRV